MSTGKAVLRWVTLVPIALAAGLLGSLAFVLVMHFGLVLGGMIEPDSQEFAVMSWLYGVAGHALAGGLSVWIAARWAPSRRVGSAIVVCLLVCVFACEELYVAFAITRDTSQWVGTIAMLVGALIGLGLVLGEHWGEREWLERDLTSGWHGAGQAAHQVLACLATLPLWWWAADPVGKWREATAGTSWFMWLVAAGGWLWRTALTAFLMYVVAFVVVLLLLLAVKLPFVLTYRMATRPSTRGPDGEDYTALTAPRPGEGVSGEDALPDLPPLTPEMIARIRPSKAEVDAARARLKERGLLRGSEGERPWRSDESPGE